MDLRRVVADEDIEAAVGDDLADRMGAGTTALKVAHYTQRGRDAREVAAESWRAWRKAERLFDEAVQADAAAPQIKAALSWFAPVGPSGRVPEPKPTCARPASTSQGNSGIK